MKIAVLLTVHNRREKTLNCLSALKKIVLPVGYKLDIFMTDDGCTDGTPEAATKEFPEINIIKGDGNLFWNRGMYRAWEAASQMSDYEFYLWLNDDTVLNDNALNILISASEIKSDAIIVGPTCDSRNPKITTYSGVDKKGRTIVPTGEIQSCDTFNGNIVLVPRKIFHQVGNLDFRYHHALGDLDYGMCAIRAGFKNYVAPKHCGVCDLNPSQPAWVRPDIPFAKRWKNFHSPLAYGEPKAMFHFNRKNYSLTHAVKVYITNHIRVVFPSLKK